MFKAKCKQCGKPLSKSDNGGLCESCTNKKASKIKNIFKSITGGFAAVVITFKVAKEVYDSIKR